MYNLTAWYSFYFVVLYIIIYSYISHFLAFLRKQGPECCHFCVTFYCHSVLFNITLLVCCWLYGAETFLNKALISVRVISLYFYWVGQWFCDNFFFFVQSKIVYTFSLPFWVLFPGPFYTTPRKLLGQYWNTGGPKDH